MKKFTLEKYLKNPDKKVVTRDGRNACIMSTDVKRAYYPILALVDKGSYEVSIFYTKNGQYCFGEENSYDLFFAIEKKEGWINLFKINSTITTGEVYNTKEEAQSAVINSAIYIATVKIEWEQ